MANELVLTNTMLPMGQGRERFDTNKAIEFAQRSTSEQTQRAYERVVREFFAFADNLHPQVIEHTHVRTWRDVLALSKHSCHQGQSSSHNQPITSCF